MKKEISDGLMDVFNSVNFRFLDVVEITEILQRRGFYQNTAFIKAQSDVWFRLNHYPFCWVEKDKQTLWGLECWLPPKQKRNIRKTNHTISPLSIGWETQHTISIERAEITNGTFPLRGQTGKSFIASMDEKQREHSIVELICYGSEKFICALTHNDNEKNWMLEGMALQRWYKENDIQSGDKIWLSVESIIPISLRIYTEWDRDADTYRRYEQRRKFETLHYIDLPIRDLIWLYFKRNPQVAHRSDIERAVLAERPEISARSIDVCLGANPHLFSPVGKGKWGLKEWGVEEVSMVLHPKGSDPATVVDKNLPTVIVSLDYVLANIDAEDLVYKILRGSKDSLSVSQITEKISKYLVVDKSLLTRTTFFNVSDSRFVRCQDGTFTLRENLEEVIGQLVARERDLTESLEQANEEVDRLKEEILSTRSLYANAWSRERIALGQVLSALLAEIISYIGYSNLQVIFNLLRHKLELHRTEDESK